MGQWVVTVAGIAILSVLCDVILPEGQTRKYIKTVVGVIVTLVMLQPIVNLIGNAPTWNKQVSSHYDIEVQQTYLDMVEDKQYKLQTANIQNTLIAKGVAVSDVTFSKTDKTVTVNVGEKRSDDKLEIINSVIKVYFADYKITVKWK